MELEHKEAAFRKLQNQMRNNSQLISRYKLLSPFCVLLFILIAFWAFYNTTGIESSSQMVFGTSLVLLFILLTMIRFAILKKKKENRVLDYKIYNLLKIE